MSKINLTADILDGIIIV